MAVAAVAAEQVGGSASVLWQSDTAFGVARVERGKMALLAQEGGARGQQCTVVGAMWLVTVAAVLTDRRMFPEVGTAFLGMALEALVVERRLQQVCRARAAMWRMTIRADQLPETERMA